jgi:hypothetical protein
VCVGVPSVTLAWCPASPPHSMQPAITPPPLLAHSHAHGHPHRTSVRRLYRLDGRSSDACLAPKPDAVLFHTQSSRNLTRPFTPATQPHLLTNTRTNSVKMAAAGQQPQQPPVVKKTPVTMLSGFLGAGGCWLHGAQGAGCRRCAK